MNKQELKWVEEAEAFRSRHKQEILRLEEDLKGATDQNPIGKLARRLGKAVETINERLDESKRQGEKLAEDMRKKPEATQTIRKAQETLPAYLEYLGLFKLVWAMGVETRECLRISNSEPKKATARFKHLLEDWSEEEVQRIEMRIAKG
jgi:hypothetical protein